VPESQAKKRDFSPCPRSQGAKKPAEYPNFTSGTISFLEPVAERVYYKNSATIYQTPVFSRG
jgi:hypothetical protein